MKNIYKLIICIVIIISNSCKKSEIKNAWKFEKEIALDTISPNGIVAIDGGFWLGDTDNNRVVRIDSTGKVLQIFANADRPMHIALRDKKLLVAEYGSDRISIFQDSSRQILDMADSLEAPAGVDISEDAMLAIADFYNHRIAIKEADDLTTFGQKGTANGEFHYPTDVQFAHNSLYVADAYNNRIQVFEYPSMKHKLTFGQEDGINAATGIYVTENAVFVTDFENSRILEYDLTGKLQTVINEHLDKPTDVMFYNKKLYVSNYHSKTIAIFAGDKPVN